VLDVRACLAAGSDDGTAGIFSQSLSHEVPKDSAFVGDRGGRSRGMLSEADHAETLGCVVDEVEVSLSDAIGVVRDELCRAQDAGRDKDVRFSVGSVEVELSIAVEKTAGGEASVKVLNIFSLGGKGERSRTDTNRVTVILNPIGKGGAPFVVASDRDHRPDGD
jgi:Trypsin-co-occurring domain 2